MDGHVSSPTDLRHAFHFDQETPQWHASELFRLRALQVDDRHRKGRTEKSRSSLVLALFNYIQKNLSSYFTVLFFTPASVILNPVNTFATLIIYPVLFVLLAVVVVIFKAASELGVGGWINKLSEKYGGGYSFINWLNPSLFDKHSIEVVNAARPILAGDATTITQEDIDDTPESTTIRIFSLPLSRLLLLFSALIYERSDPLVSLASFAQSPLKADRLLQESEEVIRKQARNWGVRFEGVSDLASPDGGPYAGVFWEEGERPWVVVVFKGTSPSNFAEFLVDATIARTPGHSFFGPGSGSVHEGFYTDLFPTSSGGSDGYGTIVRHLRHVGARLQRHSGSSSPVPLWITGHSLGSALCVLLFSRLLHSPLDLGPALVLRDCYAFGTPRLGNGSFSSSVSSSLLTPLNRPNLLWRVINASDIVCRVPPGLADDEDKQGVLGEEALLNYAHVGVGVTLGCRGRNRVRVEEDRFLGKTKIVVKEGVGHGRGRRPSSRIEVVRESGGNWVRFAITLLPGFVYNHFPAAYWANLNLVEGVQSEVFGDRGDVSDVRPNGIVETVTEPAR